MSSLAEVWTWGEDPSSLLDILGAGGMLAIPTESSYGLAVDPRNDVGVATVYRFKGRPDDKALPVVVADRGQLDLVGADPTAPGLDELAALWPAPLTVVVPIRRAIAASAGEHSLAVRVPAHPRLRSLLQELGTPLTATSANLAGAPPVCDPGALRSMLAGWSSIVIDDGALMGGEASTLVQIAEEGYRVLRVGALSTGWLRERVSRPVFSAVAAEIPADESPSAP